MSDTLKPCPFCGSKARIYGNDGGNGEWIARCTKLMSCGSRGSAWLTEDEAGAAWNTRAPVVAQSATTPTDPQTIDALLAELDDARSDLAKHKAHIRLANDIITNHCIAMQSALIEQAIGKGDEAALDWIGNTLAGPGLLPSMSDAAHLPKTPEVGPAQAWFDAKTAEHEAMREQHDAAMKGKP